MKKSISATPLRFPMYNVGQRAGPPMIVTADTDTTNVTQQVKNMKMMWLLA